MRPRWLVIDRAVLCDIVKSVIDSRQVRHFVLLTAIVHLQLDDEFFLIRWVHEGDGNATHNRDFVESKVRAIIRVDIEAKETDNLEPDWQRCVSTCLCVFNLN